MIEKDISIAGTPRIAVVGVGGAGCNVVSSFYDDCYPVETTIAINTDKDALHKSRADSKLYICKEVLNGEGAHGDAVLGKRCADIHIEEIRKALAGHDVVFVVAGLGGGTGTGAMSVVIDAAQSQDILTFAVAISPFSFEGGRPIVAREGWDRIRSICMNNVIVDNDKVLQKMPNLTLNQAFGEVNLSIRAHILRSIKTIEDMFRQTRIRQVPVKVPTEEDRGVSYPIQTLLSA